MVKKQQQEEQEIANDILEVCTIVTDSDTGYVYRLTNGVYRKLPENELFQYIITEYMDQNIRYTRNKRNVTLDFLKANSFVLSSIIEDSTKGTINLQNGVYFLDKTVKCARYAEDGKHLEEYKTHFKSHVIPDYYSFNQIPVDYDPDAICPNIDKFLEEVFGHDNINEIYEFIGYILLPHVKYQRALILVGSGKNGKTTFLDMVIHFIGMNNIAQIALQDLDGKFAMINLKNIMGNVVGDLPNKALQDTGNAKRIVTDQYLSGNIKNVQGIFNFKNRCKMLYSVNELPRTKDKTTAFYRRWILKICDAVFDGEKKDVNIFEKITTPKEMSGLFNRCLEGIERLKQNNGFKNTQTEVRKLWEIDTNPIGDFIRDECNILEGCEIKSKDLFDAVNRFRKSKHLALLNGKSIGHWLRQYGILGTQRPDTEDQDNHGNKKWYTFYQDIELKEKKELKEIDLDSLEWLTE